VKRVPSFWWDFRYEPDAVIVESDDPKVPVVKTWPGHSEFAQDEAEKLMKELREGRADYRRVARAALATSKVSEK
jgi:hypothetical protein